MRHGLNVSTSDSISEMGIVDTFTRLIFADTETFSASERTVIAAFRRVEINVFRDTPEQMGEYLRNLGVREMIQLVARIRQQIETDARVIPWPEAKVGPLVLRR